MRGGDRSETSRLQMHSRTLKTLQEISWTCSSETCQSIAVNPGDGHAGTRGTSGGSLNQLAETGAWGTTRKGKGQAEGWLEKGCQLSPLPPWFPPRAPGVRGPLSETALRTCLCNTYETDVVTFSTKEQTIHLDLSHEMNQRRASHTPPFKHEQQV